MGVRGRRLQSFLRRCRGSSHRWCRQPRRGGQGWRDRFLGSPQLMEAAPAVDAVGGVRGQALGAPHDRRDRGSQVSARPGRLLLLWAVRLGRRRLASRARRQQRLALPAELGGWLVRGPAAGAPELIVRHHVDLTGWASARQREMRRDQAGIDVRCERPSPRVVISALRLSHTSGQANPRCGSILLMLGVVECSCE